MCRGDGDVYSCTIRNPRVSCLDGRQNSRVSGLGSEVEYVYSVPKPPVGAIGYLIPRRLNLLSLSIILGAIFICRSPWR